MLLLNRFSHVQLCDPLPVAHQAPLSMEFSRQENWSELPCPPLGDLPNPGIKPRSPTLQTDSLPAEPTFRSQPIRLIFFCFINTDAMWENWVQSLGWEDPLEEGMATHSGILAWRIPMDRRAW